MCVFFFYNSTKLQIKLVFSYYYLVERYYYYILYNCILYNYYYYSIQLGFPGGSEGKASACDAGHRIQSPGWEDPLEKEMATHSNTLAWKIPWAEEPGRLQSMGISKSWL